MRGPLRVVGTKCRDGKLQRRGAKERGERGHEDPLANAIADEYKIESPNLKVWTRKIIF